MRQIAAIALLALRNVFRSRIVLVLSALLFAAAFLLPLGIRSDGTPEGLIRLHLAYTLGIASFLLALATLWAGCAAVSQEADDKTLQLLLVKPVPRLRIWLGKWLALLLMDALLLALVGAAALFTLRRQLQHGGFEPAALAAAEQTVLSARETLRAPLPDVEADVRAEYARLRAAGAIPAAAAESAVRDSLRRAELARRYSIAPGAERIWTFARPSAAGWRRAPPLAVQFKADSSVPGAADVTATVALRVGDREETREVRAPVAERDGNRSRRGGGPAAGMFAGNYLRALGQLYLRLALFAAIGVTLGILFSMPVATFLTLVLILILQLSGFIVAAAQVDRAAFVANVAPFGATGHAHGEAVAAPSAAARAAATALFYAYRGTYLTLRPLLEDRTLDALSAGTYLPPRALRRNFLQQGLLLPACLALLSTAVLRRREWALPAING